ncbi:hypothetical protein BS78_03G314200 [Paspalum vaginatum]|nr:hypothetical protein BS78_03G314200 [Paspalum vaginatum]
MRAKRETGDGEGCWRAIDAEKSIFGSAGNMEVIGTQRRLAFHEFIYEADSQGSGKRKRVKRSLSKPTKWKMVEFVCRNSSRPPGGDTAPDPMLLNDLVLCKITISSEKQPAPDGGGEPQEKRLPRQQPAGCGGGGGTQGEPQQPPPFGLGAGSHGNQRPATVEAPNGGDSAVLPIDYCLGAQHVADVRWFRINTPTIFNSYYHTGMVYGGGELLGAQLAAQQQPAVAPGRAAATDAGSSEWGRCFTASRALPGNWQVPPWDLPDECFLYFDDRTNNA